MESWFVAKTKPAKERYVETCLSEKWGVAVFLPVIRRPSSNKSAFELLFPTYLFCRFDTQSTIWPAIRWVPGLCYFLGVSQQLVPVSDELIAELRQRVSWWNEGGYIPRFTPGERVVINSGPLSGAEGIFQRYLPARQRCQVLLQVLGQQNKVELPVQTLNSEHRYRRLALAT
ncbi:MAG TPA: transcription termination/antitermination NusG family protein [Dehalococcoidia bacterium]